MCHDLSEHPDGIQPVAVFRRRLSRFTALNELRKTGDSLGAVEHARLGDVSPLTFDFELLGCKGYPVVVEYKGGSGSIALDNIGERRPDFLVDWPVRVEPSADVSLEQPRTHLAVHLIEVDDADESDMELFPALGLAGDHLWK